MEVLWRNYHLRGSTIAERPVTAISASLKLNVLQQYSACACLWNSQLLIFTARYSRSCDCGVLCSVGST